MYSAQVSHSFSQCNAVLASLRNVSSEGWHLQVKYYLEGYPEPRILLFEMHRSSGHETITWPHVHVPCLMD